MTKGMQYIILMFVVLVAVFTIPLWMTNLYYIHLLVIIFLNTVLAISMNLIIKIGYLSLGHAAYVGIGAYTSAILATRFGMPFFLTFWLAGAASAVVALFMGRITLGMRGIYFTIATFAFTEVFRGICVADKEFLGGPGGIMNIPSPLQIEIKTQFYYLTIVFMIGTLYVFYKLGRSSFGRLCDGLSLSDVLEECVGINTRRVKTVVFVLSCTFAGFVGSLIAHYLGHVSPSNFTMDMSVDIVVYCAVGGFGSMAGAALGAVLMTVISELLYGIGFYKMLVVGLILIGVILGLPEGLRSLPFLRSNTIWR